MVSSTLQLSPRWLLLLVSTLVGAPSNAMILSPAGQATGTRQRSLATDPKADSKPIVSKNPGSDGKIRVLVFVAVSQKPQTMDTAMRNIHALKNHFLIKSEVFMAHYDQQRESWLKANAEWYSANVDHSVESSGGKFLLAQQHLPGFLANHSYEWIWLLDEDVDFSGTNITRMFLDAAETEAFILQPALRNSEFPAHGKAAHSQAEGQNCQPDDSFCQHLAQHSECMFRYVNRVEVMTPFIKQDALLTILTGCHNCIHKESLWGLDNIWCAWIAEQNHKLPSIGCAVLDRVTVSHRNFKTLDKYDPNGSGLRDYNRAGNDVRKHYGKYWCGPERTIRCVPLHI